MTRLLPQTFQLRNASLLASAMETPWRMIAILALARHAAAAMCRTYAARIAAGIERAWRSSSLDGGFYPSPVEHFSSMGVHGCDFCASGAF